jgi:type I restriction enzyme S subunit
MSPEGWERRRVREFSERLKRVNVEGLDLEPLSITKDRGVILQSEKYNKRIATDPHKYVFAEDGDFAFDPMSLYYGAIGRVDGIGRGLVSPDYVVFRADASVDPDFLHRLLRYPEMHKLYEALSETGNTFGKRRRLYWSIFEDIELELPPRPEQTKIAAILASVDQAIEAMQAVIEQLRVVKKAMMAELLTRGLRGRHERFKQSEMGEVPEHWHLATLGECGRWLSGGTPSKQDASLWTGPIPWVSPKDMKKARIGDAMDHVAEAALARGTQLAPVGSILMVVRGMILAHTFPVALTTVPVAFNQDIKALVPSHEFDCEFVLYWLQHLGAEILQAAEVANHGTKRLPSELLFACAVPRPPIAEQREIASVIRTLDERLGCEAAALAQIGEVRLGLMSVLLTGDVRVTPDPEAV